jgi:hypothetical protein
MLFSQFVKFQKDGILKIQAANYINGTNTQIGENK